MFKNQLFKIICLVSALTGAILGLSAIIPPAIFNVLILLMFIMAPFIILYFKHLKLITELEIDKGIIYGAISGFCGFIGFSVIFFPLAFIIDAIFKTESLLWVKVVCQNFVFLVGMVFFTALLCALLNAFSGFLTAYLLEYFKKGK